MLVTTATAPKILKTVLSENIVHRIPPIRLPTA